MNTLPDTTDPLEVALDARAKGIVAIPCNGKVPLVKWKPWQSEMPSLETQMAWFRDTRVNVAIITTGMILFDIDDPALVGLVLEHCGPTPHVVHTPRGGTHLGYRARNGVKVCNQVRIRGHPIDIRTNGGIEVIPPSVTELGAYAGLPEGLRRISELPVAKVGWTRERVRRTLKPIEQLGDGDERIRRACGYLATIEGAVSGQRGHDRTFRVACVLTHKFGLTFEQAWPLFKEWSEAQCEPPWDDRALTHKLEDALKKR